jgi:chemotaxis signal transduction protein
MSMLLFYTGENCFAIDTGSILRIVPKVLLKKIPYSAAYMAGILNLGGKSIQVIDFCQLIEQREARNFMLTRIILIKDPQPHSEKVVGILGEKVEEIMDLRPEQFSKTEFSLHPFPYLNKVYCDDKRIIHYINVEELFRFLQVEN